MSEELPDEAYGLALCALPGMGPARLQALLGALPPREAWDAIRGGELPASVLQRGARSPDLALRWRQAAAALDPAALWDRCVRAAHGVALRGRPGYPRELADDHDPAEVVSWRGDPTALAAPRAAVVGTRACTRYGRDVARALGEELSAAGVVVVSGLALGIDGAAHQGALRAGGAPPVGVVASGLDVPYPRQHAELWEAVAGAGLLLTEAAPGRRPEAWRFPARNRLIAALADVVIVVESHDRGGSLHTVTEALARDRVVMAVPGPVTSPASAGTNALLAQGCAPILDARDALVALGMVVPGPRRSPAAPPTAPEHAPLLDAFGWRPATLGELVARTGATPACVALALARLEAEGWVVSRGAWFERTAPAAPA